MTISELGRRAQVSDATGEVLQAPGVQGFQEFKILSPRMWLPSPNQFTAKSNLLIL